MNKGDLVSAIAEKSGLTKADSKKALDAAISTIVETLKSGDKVSLVGFGTYSISVRQSRNGINPLTKEKIVIPEKKVIKFKAGAEVEESIQ